MTETTPASPTYSPQSPGYYSSDGEPWVDRDEVWGPDHVTDEEVFKQRAIADALSANNTTEETPASPTVTMDPMGPEVPPRSPTVTMDPAGPEVPPEVERGKKCRSRRAGKKAQERLYVVLYNQGVYGESCKSLAVGTYEGPEAAKGKLITLKRHGATTFKSDKPTLLKFALPEGLKFKDGYCARESIDLNGPPGQRWRKPSINTHASFKEAPEFVQAEVAFGYGSDEWKKVEKRFRSI
jgi:hypothetical protein